MGKQKPRSAKPLLVIFALRKLTASVGVAEPGWKKRRTIGPPFFGSYLHIFLLERDRYRAEPDGARRKLCKVRTCEILA